tara:strand:- start:3205 stop:3648 length:444 start_codon:yes stop_codon:yes gene_type:complete
MLEKLSKRDKDWRDIAYKICGNKSLADDLVQDMYLKLHDKSYDKINEWFVWVTIKNIFLNGLKQKHKKHEISIELFYNIEDLVNDDNILSKRKEVSDALDSLDLWDREILLQTSENSLRALSKETGISVSTLFHNKKIALQKLKDKL